jgi:hypothetical protein
VAFVEERERPDALILLLAPTMRRLIVTMEAVWLLMNVMFVVVLE